MGVLIHQPIESRLGKFHQCRITDSDDISGARFAGEHRHFTDTLARGYFPNDDLASVLIGNPSQ